MSGEEVSYKVLSINKSYTNMTIKLQEFINDCPDHRITTNFSGRDLFGISPRVENILLSVCPGGGTLNGNDSFTLCSHNQRNTTVYYLNNKQAIGNNSCKVIEVPVFTEALKDLHRSGNLLNVLLEGFEVKFYEVYYSWCSKCEGSDGICGSSDTSNFYCSKKSDKRHLILIIGSVAAASAMGIVILIVLVICAKRTQSRSKYMLSLTEGTSKNQNVEAFLKSYGSLAPKRYTYADTRAMTNSFNSKLGEGGYGRVYKGELSDGRLVAVKILKNLKDDGEGFINEVLSISRTNHINVVTLLGFCSHGKNRALVFEFMPNGSLEKYICRESGQSLPSETIFNIAIGIARGLHYLHRGCNTRILHFDIKPHNILLDQDFCPTISDFGLAKLSLSKDSTISMLEARGTIGYIAPEVFCRNFGGISHKSDVYSYGMMVLDLVCGRNIKSTHVQQSSELYFPDWIYNQLEQEDVLVDGIMNQEETELKRKMILVSLWCIQTYPSNRPSMNGVVEMLEGELKSLEMPPKPHLFSPPRSTIHSSGTHVTTS